MRTIKRLWDGLKAFRHSPKKLIITLVLSVILIALSVYSFNKRQKTGIDYKTILDETAITVDESSRTFREVALYVAYEEAVVEEQAVVYDPENPKKYWNVHTDGIFVRLAARNAASQMALHDEIFYQMAMEEGIVLDAEEKESLRSKQQDFWYDLCDDDKQIRLGIEQKDIEAAMERMMYAQKMQLIYANSKGLAYEDFNFDQEAYEKLQKNYNNKINEKLWEQLQFGDISLEH